MFFPVKAFYETATTELRSESGLERMKRNQLWHMQRPGEETKRGHLGGDTKSKAATTCQVGRASSPMGLPALGRLGVVSTDNSLGRSETAKQNLQTPLRLSCEIDVTLTELDTDKISFVIVEMRISHI